MTPAIKTNLFVPFEPNAPLHLEERLRLVSNTSTIKGLFFQAIEDEAERVSGSCISHQKYIAFRDYPTHDFILLLAQAAERIYPTRAPKDAIRLLGQLHYRAFKAHMVGRVLLSFAGNFLDSALGVLSRAYSLSGKGASAELLHSSSSSAIISLRGCWDFPDSHEVGVFEGVLDAFGVEGEVLVRPISFSEVDLSLTWRRKPQGL